MKKKIKKVSSYTNKERELLKLAKKNLIHLVKEEEYFLKTEKVLIKKIRTVKSMLELHKLAKEADLTPGVWNITSKERKIIMKDRRSKHKHKKE